MEIENILDFCTQQEFRVIEIKKSLQNYKTKNQNLNLQYLLPTLFKPSSSKGSLNNVTSHHSSKHPRHLPRASPEHSSKHSSQNSSKHSPKRSSNHSLSNSNNSHELNVSKSENYPFVNDPSNFGILPNPRSVAVPSNAVKNDTSSP